MVARLPPTYVGVKTALGMRGPVNVMGVVVDIWGGAYKTGGTSTCITFTIKDCDLDNGHLWDGLRIKYFKDTESLLPPVRLGDVCLLRGLFIKLLPDQKMTGVVAENKTVPYAIFRPDRDPTSSHSALTGPTAFEPTYAEKTYAASLLEASPGQFRSATLTRANYAQVTASKPAPTNRKFSLLEDIQEGQFVDLIGEIVKILGNDSEKASLYLTDYTSNDKLFNYASDNADDQKLGREGDPHGYIQRQGKKWHGPSGRMSLQITLWEPHASFVRGNFEIGELVRLKNVKIKKSYTEEGILEGVIHGNRDDPSKVNALQVNIQGDPRAQQLLSRKQAYIEAHPKKQKRKSDEADDRPSKKPNRRQSKAAPKKETGQTILDIKKRMGVNRNVEPRVPPSGVHALSLEAIINNPSHNNSGPKGVTYRLPFQNLCYLTTVRVVDFYPPMLEDFAVQQEHTSHAYDRKHDPATLGTIKKWEWRFCLLVESPTPATAGQPKERLKLFVSDYEAQHLLQESATDLRQDSRKLEQLREKLFLLWGELEESKSKTIKDSKSLKPASSTPFNCCIIEYGVRCSHARGSKKSSNGRLQGCKDRNCFGWERRFGLSKTTIHA
ncbi:hypothetical protein BDW74DRAFT_79615 [Aspergillus multicolor]|uniref:telomere-binding alpha subunit central domain protein n=1 Tax=Aspergillus multicolor TaxID=41759 RepID=UPI003CCCE863